MLYKWISIFILILSNIGISLTIIYVYFWNKKMVFQAVKILAAYAFSFFTLGIVFYYLGRKDLSADAIGSLNLLSTPVVECAMIPLLKLMNAKVVKEENQDN